MSYPYRSSASLLPLFLACVVAACSASRTSPDASLPASDTGTVVAAPDTGTPLGTCFEGEVMIATHALDPAERPHLSPLALVARDDGWVAVYQFRSSPYVVSIDPAGHVRWSQPLSFFAPPSESPVALEPSSLVVTAPLRRLDVEPGSVEATLWSPIEASAFAGSPPDDQELVAAFGQLALLRVLTRGRTVSTDLRLLDLALDTSPDGFQVALAQALPADAPYVSAGTFAFVGPSALRSLISVGSQWRSTLQDFAPDALGTAAFALRTVEDVSWDAQGEFLPVGLACDGRAALTSRYAADGTYEAYIMPIPPGPVCLQSGLTLPGPAQALAEDGPYLAVATDRQLDLFWWGAAAPLAQLSFDGVQAGAVRAAVRAPSVHRLEGNVVAGAIFVRAGAEPGTVSLGMRCATPAP